MYAYLASICFLLLSSALVKAWPATTPWDDQSSQNMHWNSFGNGMDKMMPMQHALGHPMRQPLSSFQNGPSSMDTAGPYDMFQHSEQGPPQGPSPQSPQWPGMSDWDDTAMPRPPPPGHHGPYTPFGAPGDGPNGNAMASITVQYNVTYAYSPSGWELLEVVPANATFYPASSERVSQMTNDPSENSALPTPQHWWWPKPSESQIADKNGKTHEEKFAFIKKMMAKPPQGNY